HDVVNGEMRGRDEIREVVTAYRAAFSDLHLVIEDQIAEGDTVVTRWSATGTHDGPLGGAPPTGRSGKLIGVNISRFSGLEIVPVTPAVVVALALANVTVPKFESGSTRQRPNESHADGASATHSADETSRAAIVSFFVKLVLRVRLAIFSVTAVPLTVTD